MAAAGLSAGEVGSAAMASAMRPSARRSRYGGDGSISDARRLKALEDENRRLKSFLAESMLDLRRH